MKIGIVLGAALAFAPAVALAQTNQAQQRNQQQMQNQQMIQNQAQKQNQQDLTTQKLLTKDAKLVGSVESAEVRAFPEQMSKSSSQNIEKEGLVGVGALDRVWTTKQSYRQTVSSFDSKLNGEGIEPIAKTTTQSSTAWNVRMPDGHIANVVVRNTQPTTIESMQAAEVVGTMNENAQPGNAQQPTSTSKNKMTTPGSANPSNTNPSNTNPSQRY